MKRTTLILTLIMVAMTATRCTYHNAEEYFYADPNACDTSAVSYLTDLVPIFENNCYSCHNSIDRTAGITVDNYSGVKLAAESGRLLGAIKHENGFRKMPQGSAKLDTCSINYIEAWISQGMPEN